MGSEWQNVSSKLKRRAHPENMKLHSFIGIQGFQPVIFFFIYWGGGRGLLCLPFIDSDTLNSNTIKWY